MWVSTWPSAPARWPPLVKHRPSVLATMRPGMPSCANCWRRCRRAWCCWRPLAGTRRAWRVACPRGGGGLEAWGAAEGPERRMLAAEQRRELTALVVRRRQLVAMLVAERQRLALAHPKAKPSILRIMATIAEQLNDLDGQLKEHVLAHHADLAALLTSVKGVGPTTASTL